MAIIVLSLPLYVFVDVHCVHLSGGSSGGRGGGNLWRYFWKLGGTSIKFQIKLQVKLILHPRAVVHFFCRNIAEIYIYLSEAEGSPPGSQTGEDSKGMQREPSREINLLEFVPESDSEECGVQEQVQCRTIKVSARERILLMIPPSLSHTQ